MNNMTKEKIIEELIELEPGLASSPTKLKELVSLLITNNPNIKADNNFKNNLRTRLEAYGTLINIESKQKTNFLSFLSPVFLGALGLFIFIQYNSITTIDDISKNNSSSNIIISSDFMLEEVKKLEEEDNKVSEGEILIIKELDKNNEIIDEKLPVTTIANNKTNNNLLEEQNNEKNIKLENTKVIDDKIEDVKLRDTKVIETSESIETSTNSSLGDIDVLDDGVNPMLETTDLNGEENNIEDEGLEPTANQIDFGEIPVDFAEPDTSFEEANLPSVDGDYIISEIEENNYVSEDADYDESSISGDIIDTEKAIQDCLLEFNYNKRKFIKNTCESLSGTIITDTDEKYECETQIGEIINLENAGEKICK